MINARHTTNRWFVLVLVCFAQFMVILDATIVNVALPSIQKGLHFSPSDLQWVVNAYTLVFGGFLLLGGRAGDLFGRKQLFLGGIVLFAVASLINGLSTSSGMLIAGRALQGLGGALISPVALSIITTTFAEGPERTKALGVWSGIAAGGAAFGLLAGGVLTQLLSWQWIFFVNVPIGILAFTLSFRYLPNVLSLHAHRRLDVLGAVAVTGGLLTIVYAIVNVKTYGWGSSHTIILGAIGFALLGAFIVIERTVKSPLIRLGIFRIRSIATANLVMMLVAAGMFSLFFFASLYLQIILGYGPLNAGLAFLPVTVGIGIGAGLAQQLIKRIGVRAVGSIGMLLAASGLFLMSRTPVDGHYIQDVFPGLVVMAIGMGLTFVPVTLIATTGVAPEDAGLASGLLNTAQQVGGAIGLAVLSTLAANTTTEKLAALGHQPSPLDLPTALVDGFHVAFIAGAVMIASGSVLLSLLLRGHHVAKTAHDQQAQVA